MPPLSPPRLLWCAALALVLACGQPALAFETPPLLKASDFLPKSLLSGPDFRVDPQVTSDGYLNTYVIHSPFGDFTAVSTALAATRIQEIKAMAAMDAVSSSAQFGNALAGKGAQTLKGAVNLVTDPLDTVGGALSGVGKFFQRAQESLTSDKSQYEDSAAQQLVGYSQVKRDYAKQFRVDPYSTNAVMQKKLTDLASAGYAGTITGAALQALIPGGVGVAVGAVSGSAVLGGVDVSVAPQDLRRRNRQDLLDMGVSQAVTRLFIDNTVFTPTQQTWTVQALKALPGVRNKEAFVGFLVDTPDQDLALFRQRMSQMYAGYAQAVSPLESFVTLGRFVGCARPDGVVVLAFPLDYLVWTEGTAKLVRALAGTVQETGAAGVELWVTGKVSPQTKKELTRLGWKVHEKAQDRLLGPLPGAS